MKTILNFLKSYGLTLVLVFSLGTQIVNCNGAATDNIADLIPPTGGGGGGGGGGQTDFGDPDSDFFIGVVSTTTPISHVRTAGAFGTKCKISEDSATNEDLTCYVDVPEGILYYSGLELSYNVPPNMCAYLTRTPYWFYSDHAGVGPGFVEYISYKTVSTSTVTSETTTTFSYRCRIGNTPGTTVTDADCDDISQLEVTTEIDPDGASGNGSFTTFCAYDDTPQAGENCCFGTYLLRISDVVENRLDGVVSGTSETTVRSLEANKSWGGDYKKCIGGQARTDWDFFTGTFNFPIPAISVATAGVQQTFKIKSINDSLESSVLANNSTKHIANFYNSVSHTHGPINAGPANSNLPYAVNPIDDLSASLYLDSHDVDDDQVTSLGKGNDAYTFACLDSAYETKHRIKVYVREWDTYSDYLAYISSSGATSAPDNAGTSPSVNCEGLPGPCNDYNDWDNFVNSLSGGAYSTAVSATTRSMNFPKLKYKN